MKKMKITLGETEQKIAKHIAKSRYKANRLKGNPRAIIGPQSSYTTDLEGAGSELAAAKVLNVWPDLEINHLPDHDLTFNNKTIDVKATRYENGKLLIAKNKLKKPCDYYMLMIGTFPNYRLAGFCKKEDVLCNEAIVDVGWGDSYGREQDQLQSLEDFLNENKS